MKYIVLLFTCVLVFTSCGSKKAYLDRNNADKSLQDAVKKISKAPDDVKSAEAIPQLYTLIQKKHLDQIEAYASSQQLNKWDYIVSEYEHLQSAYNSIMSVPAAYKVVQPESYSSKLFAAKESAADTYFESGLVYFNKPGRDNAKAAYLAFKKASSFVPGFKDVDEKMKIAYEKAIINVVINPIQDSYFSSSNEWGSWGTNYSNEYFQQKLLQDLTNYNRTPARYYSLWEAQRRSFFPDWTIDFRVRSVLVPRPQTTNSSRQVNKQIQIGVDTAGRPVYVTASATIHTTITNLISKASLEVSITDLASKLSKSYRIYNESYKWEQKSATFSGDRRALSQQDWDLINNSVSINMMPKKEEILVELYKRIYPQVLSQIRMAVSW
jgi:hypothetical protein